jgi:lysine-N-methylase
VKENVRMCYPSYFKEFKCVGGNCEDNCCNEWEINIDKNTFEMYEKIQDRKMNKYVNNNIVLYGYSKNSFMSGYGRSYIEDELPIPKYLIIFVNDLYKQWKENNKHFEKLD